MEHSIYSFFKDYGNCTFEYYLNILKQVVTLKKKMHVQLNCYKEKKHSTKGV